MQPRQPEQEPLQKQLAPPPPPYSRALSGKFYNGTAMRAFEDMTVSELSRHKRKGFGPDPEEYAHWLAAWEKATLLRPIGFTQTDSGLLLQPVKERTCDFGKRVR